MGSHRSVDGGASSDRALVISPSATGRTRFTQPPFRRSTTVTAFRRSRDLSASDSLVAGFLTSLSQSQDSRPQSRSWRGDLTALTKAWSTDCSSLQRPGGETPPPNWPLIAERPTVLDGLVQSLAFMDIQECVILKSVPGEGVVVELPSVKAERADRTVHNPGRVISSGPYVTARDFA
jgi:hypothetical protein